MTPLSLSPLVLLFCLSLSLSLCHSWPPSPPPLSPSCAVDSHRFPFLRSSSRSLGPPAARHPHSSLSLHRHLLLYHVSPRTCHHTYLPTHPCICSNAVHHPQPTFSHSSLALAPHLYPETLVTYNPTMFPLCSILSFSGSRTRRYGSSSPHSSPADSLALVSFRCFVLLVSMFRMSFWLGC